MKKITGKLFVLAFSLAFYVNGLAQVECESDPSLYAFDLEDLQAICVNQPPDDEAKFVLIDSTEALDDGTKSDIRAYLNWDQLDFLEKTTDVSHGMARFGEHHMGKLPLTTVCRPPETVSRWFANRADNDELKELYACAVEPIRINRQSTASGYVLEGLLDGVTGAGQSHIIETVNHVFTNVRYGLATSEKRIFILVSDLLQHSGRFDFYKECKNVGADGIPSCRTYEEYSNRDPKIAKYLKAKTPVLKPDDRIFLYQLNHQKKTNAVYWANTDLVKGHRDASGNIVRSSVNYRKATWEAEKFWRSYFIAAGVDASNITYTFQEDRSVKKTIGQ